MRRAAAAMLLAGCVSRGEIAALPPAELRTSLSPSAAAQCVHRDLSGEIGGSYTFAADEASAEVQVRTERNSSVVALVRFDRAGSATSVRVNSQRSLAGNPFLPAERVANALSRC